MKNIKVIGLGVILAITTLGCYSMNTAYVNPNRLGVNNVEIICAQYDDRQEALNKIHKAKQGGYSPLTVSDKNYNLLGFSWSRTEVCYDVKK